MKWNAKSRTLIVCYGVAAVFSVFSFRLVQLQVVDHDHYAGMAAKKHIRQQTIYARRGGILDCNDEVLAASIPVRRVIGDASRVKNPEKSAAILAEYLDVDPKEVAKKLASKKRYMVIKKGVPELKARELKHALRKAGCYAGVDFEVASQRLYPNANMLSHVVGFTNHTYHGVQGVEKTMDRYLSGENGYRYIEKDRTGKEIVPYRGQERSARDGCDVRLTVDMGIQQIVETEIDALVEEYSPESVTIVIMEPHTGEVLALANRPDFDLNAIGDAKNFQMKNHAVISMVEPGSTFKIVPTGAALNEGVVDRDTLIFCENGRFRYGGATLKDHHPYGELSVSDILVKSSNIGCAKLAMQLGDLTFYEYIRKFGFGSRTGVGLPGEIPGLVHPPHKWSKISITRLPMGHEIGVTPLQMVTAMSVIANGGVLMKPSIIKSVQDTEGVVIANYAPQAVRRVISRDAAYKVTEALQGVVSDKGTARRAKIENYAVAGKTGTAQKVDPKGGYMRGKYVVSFLGFMPAENPAFTALVIVDNPVTKPGQYYGGLVAAPAFAKIGKRIAQYMDLPYSPVPILEETGTKITSLTH